MKIIKQGNIEKKPKKSLIGYSRYIFVCKNCQCVFEVNSDEFKNDDRDLPSPYVNCPCCNHYEFKNNGKRIKIKD